MPATAQLALYRIIQESLTNVLKHARSARTVRVQLQREPSAVRFCVEDDGAPAAGHSITRPGHGLTGMDERARIFGGQLTAGPGENGGWSVRGVLHLAEVVS
jgi:signal transduction histidine kinase